MRKKVPKNIINIIMKMAFDILINIYRPNPITILSSNCIGTRLYQSAKMKYLSPTINLWFQPKDFIKFIDNLDFYLSQDLVELNNSETSYPCGSLADIIINFQHYDSFEDAKKKWEMRKERINLKRVIIIFTDRDGANIDDISKVSQHQNAIVFCSNKKRNLLGNRGNICYIKSEGDCVEDLYSNYHKMLFSFPFKKFSKI